MKRWFWVLDVVVVVSFATVGSDFHGAAFDFGGVLGVAAPFLVALSAGVAVLRAWRDPLSILHGFVLGVITVSVGMLLRHYLWGDGTAISFVIVATVYIVGLMVGWRLVVVAVKWLRNRSRSADATV